MRKKILILAHSYGMQFVESCNQYTQLFDKNNYAVTVAFLLGAPDVTTRHKIVAEKILFLDLAPRALRGLKWRAIWKVLALCRAEAYEIVVCHRYKPTYIMLFVAQCCRIQALLFVMHAFGTLAPLPRRFLIAALFKKNMLFAAVSNAARDDMRHDAFLIPKAKIITLYNIIDYSYFEKQMLSRIDARQQLNLSEDVFIFGHIGRLVKEKDQDNLIRAFAKIEALCPNSKLIIIGDGKVEMELKTLTAELNLTDKIIFPGFILDGFRLMKAFDTFVLTSTEEAFGRVSLEAMVAKIPLIATNISGIPEVVGDSGFLVEAANSDGLAAALLRVYQLSQTERDNWGEKGYRQMRRHFSIEPFAAIFWELPLFATLKMESV
jgi:glycosyltransferase involved in cell wall biosynthesis